MNHRPINIIAVIAFLAVSCLAQNSTTNNDATATRVDEYIKLEQQLQRIPGISLAVIKDGQIMLARGYGFANVEHQVPAKPETIFQSGSVGKQFTATAVMMLVADGKLNLEDKINKYFSDAPADWQNITIRHLLTHTAGTTDYPRDFDFRRDYSEAELLKRAEAIPLAFQPGDKWSYSNLGYVILGILIHKVSGKFYGDFLQERIFQPLGMNTARIISEADIVPNRSAGYTLVKGELKNQDWVSPSLNTTADGALYLTVYDMAKWDAALYTDKLLPQANLEQMWTRVKLKDGKTEGYGFGWSLGYVRGHRIVEHGGAWQGFKSHIARYVNDKLTVVVFANLTQANPTRIAHGIAAIYNAELAPILPQPIEDKQPEVTSLAKKIWQQIIDGPLDEQLFDSEAWPEISRNANRSRDVLKPLGAVQSMQLIERSTQNDRRLYRYRLAFAETSLSYTIILTKEGRIAALRLQPL